jgi:methylisocitrate lyase
MGYNLVIFPVTAFRAMMKAAQDALNTLMTEGTQKGIIKNLMTRKEFYDLIDYYAYEKMDAKTMKHALRLKRNHR